MIIMFFQIQKWRWWWVNNDKSPTWHLNTLTAASFPSVSSFDLEIRLKIFKLCENFQKIFPAPYMNVFTFSWIPSSFDLNWTLLFSGGPGKRYALRLKRLSSYLLSVKHFNFLAAPLTICSLVWSDKMNLEDSEDLDFSAWKHVKSPSMLHVQ